MGEQEWSAKGSDCCSPFNTCLLSWCCPCIVYGRAHHRVRNGNLQTYSCSNGSCFGYAALTCCGMQWILNWTQRSDIRAKYGLKGNGCTDCLCACCCTPCDLTQQDKEAEYRENLLPTAQPQKHEGMQYQPQPQGYQPQPQGYQPQPQGYQPQHQGYH